MPTKNQNTDLYNGLESLKKTLASFDVDSFLGNQNSPVPEQNQGSGFEFDFGGSDDGFDSTINDLLNEAGQSSTKTVDEDEIRKNIMKQFQGEIDATNLIYDDILADTKLRGANREGSGRAMQFAGGLRGSGRGQAQTEKILDKNEGERRAVQAERAAAIGNIMGNVRAATTARLTEERNAKQQGADAYLELIDLQEERTTQGINEVVGALVNQGIDFEHLAPNELEEITKNLRVTPQKLQEAYLAATAADRSAEQTSSREAAIVGLVGQGINDPAELFDLINYNEAGERVGDISLAEIRSVTEDLKQEDDTFVLSQGQRRFRTNADGTTEEIAFNPKTYAPKDGDDDFGSTPDIISFEEWRTTDAANQVLQEAQESDQSSFGEEKATATLREAYDAAVTEAKKGSRSLGKITTTQKNNLKQAGLEHSDSNAQSFYINTPSAFQDYYSRQLSLGNVEEGATAQEISELLDLYEQEKEAGKEDDLETLLAGLRSAQ